MVRAARVAGLDILIASEWELVGSHSCRISPAYAEGGWRISPRNAREFEALSAAGVGIQEIFPSAQAAAACASTVLGIAPRMRQHNIQYTIEPAGIGIQCARYPKKPRPWTLMWASELRRPKWLAHEYYERSWRTRRELCEELAPLVLSST